MKYKSDLTFCEEQKELVFFTNDINIWLLMASIITPKYFAGLTDAK